MKRQIAPRLFRVLGYCLIAILAGAACAQETQPAQRTAEAHTQNDPGAAVSRAEANIPFDFWIAGIMKLGVDCRAYSGPGVVRDRRYKHLRKETTFLPL